MRQFSVILLVVGMVVAMAVVPASAGYKDQWAKYRTTMTRSDRQQDRLLHRYAVAVEMRLRAGPAAASRRPLTATATACSTRTDECPGTPRGATVDARGCPSDSDGDGVYDGIDQCPGTPRGATVDAKGCPFDSDNDGVFDGIDKCPNTPAGTKVDATGCPVVVEKFIDTGIISTTAILFDLEKATLKSESKSELDRIGAVLIQVPELVVEIGGHTDATGTDKYNLKLSDARAKAVRDYLVANFPQITAGNLTAKGYGESAPVATNKTKEGRAANRRVEFKIVK